MDTSVAATNFSPTENATTIDDGDLMPRYYSLAYRIVGCLFVSLIFVVGMLGNSMVVAVVWRTRSMHTPTNCYLVSLACADMILLLSANIVTIIQYFLIIGHSPIGSVGCSVMVFAQYLGVNVSALSMTAFTIERYIAVCHPMRAHAMCTVQRARRIIGALWVCGVLYCAAWLALATTKPRRFADGTVIMMCTFRLERSQYATYYLADLLIFYVVPLVVITVLYALIARALFAADTNMAGVNDGDNAAMTPGDHGQQQSLTRMSGNNSRNQVIKMLAVVVVMFALLWLPYRVFVVYRSFYTDQPVDLWLLLFCRIMVYMNSAINPILYNAMSVKFRRAFRRLLQCADKRRGARQNSTLYLPPRHAVSMPKTAKYAAPK